MAIASPARQAEPPATIPFPGPKEPELRVYTVFRVHGKPYQFKIEVWTDDRFEASLVSLVTGLPCHHLSGEEVKRLAARSLPAISR